MGFFSSGSGKSGGGNKGGGGSSKGNSSSRGFGSRAVPGTSYKSDRSVSHSTHQSGKTNTGHSRVKK